MIKLFKDEAINTLGHFAGGYILCYAFVPREALWVLLTFTFLAGALRELWQFYRGSRRMYPRKFWIKVMDTAGWVVGALIYYFIRLQWGFGG